MKNKARLIREPAEVKRTIERGKYREYLPHHERNKDGSLWLEVKSDTLPECPASSSP